MINVIYVIKQLIILGNFNSDIIYLLVTAANSGVSLN